MKSFLPTGAAAVRFLSLALFASMASAAPATLPGTAAGKLGGELIRHVNADTPAQVRQWAPAILSAKITKADQTD